MRISTTEKYCAIKIFALFFAFYFILTRVSAAPLLYPDEAGYIGWANRMLSGHGSGFRYLPGYSVLIAPLIAAGGTATRYFPLITALNALLGGLFAVSVFKLSQKLEFKHPIFATIAVGLYPSFGIGANFAMTECMTALLFMLLCILVFKLSQNINSLKLWILTTAVAGALCITHSRTIAILPALAISLFPKVKKDGKRLIKLLFFGILIIGACLSTALVGYLLLNTETINAAHLAHQAAGLFTIKGFLSFIGTFVAQLSYLVLSTYGFFVLGIYYCIKLVKTHKATALFVLLSFLFSAILSAVFMYHHEASVQIIYGRYNEYVLYPILCAGVSGYLTTGKGRKFLSIGFVLCVITACVYHSKLTMANITANNVWGIYIYKLLFNSFSYLPYVIMAGIITAVIFMLKNKKAAVCLLLGIFIFSLAFTEYDYFYKGAVQRYETPQLVSHLHGNKKIQVDIVEGDALIYPWEYYNYTVCNPHLETAEDADLLLTNKRQDYALMGAEKYSKLKLYSKSAKEGVDLSGLPSAKVVASAEGNTIKVSFKNNGRPWLCLLSADNITEAVRAGLRVYKNNELVADLRCDFADNVYDKASAEFDFSFDDGEYTVIAETIREFKCRGGEAAYSLVKKNGEIVLLPSHFEKEEGFHSFDPLTMPDISGFYRYYVTEDGAEINNILLEGKTLVLKTFGEAKELDVKVFADGRKLEFLKYQDGCYHYSLNTRAENIRIESETYVLNDNPLSFLTTQSNFKPVDWFVRGMKKVFGIRLDHRKYGVDIKAIEILD